MSNILSVKNLSYSKLFKNMSFSIAEKSFNILIGKNGVGKTTLLYSLLGLKSCSGEIKLKYERKDIGIVSDFSEITKENAFSYLLQMLLDLGYDRENASKIIYNVSKKLGIEKILDINKEDLTNEEYLLVLLTHSIIHNPKLVIIDNTLDELTETNKNNFIKYLLDMKITVILVTNDSRYFKYSNKLLIMTPNKMEIVNDSKSISKLESLLIKNNSELPFELELSSKLYSYGVIKEIYSSNSELVNNIWK